MHMGWCGSSVPHLCHLYRYPPHHRLGHLQRNHGVCAGVGVGPSPEGDHRVCVHTDTSLHCSHACPICTLVDMTARTFRQIHINANVNGSLWRNSQEHTYGQPREAPLHA